MVSFNDFCCGSFSRKDEESKQAAITRKLLGESEELRNLEARLKAAYVTKERMVQQQEVITIIDAYEWICNVP